MKDYSRAFDTIAEKMAQGWQTALIDLVEFMPATETSVLRKCGELFINAQEDERATAVFNKLHDNDQLIKLYVRKQMWDHAIQLFEKSPTMDKREIYVPYAEWLIAQDKFDDAVQAYQRAGDLGVVSSTLATLARNAVIEYRYDHLASVQFSHSLFLSTHLKIQ